MAISRAWGLGLIVGAAGLAGAADAAEPPGAIRHVVVYREAGRFAGWPANHGIWSWGDEILVGFSRGTYKDRGPYHHIDHDRARGVPPGPQPRRRRHLGGRAAGAAGGARRHARDAPRHSSRRGPRRRRPVDLPEPIDFAHPDFAMTVRMEDANTGTSRYYFSYDRGHTWRGPYRLPTFGQAGVMARTDYLVNGPSDCHLFLTASKPDGKEGRPFAARTTDGGLSWRFLGFIGPEPSRLRHHAGDGPGLADGPGDDDPPQGPAAELDRRLRLARRRPDVVVPLDPRARHRRGQPAEPAPPPRRPPRLIYGVRARPYGIRARLSADRGATWGPAIVLRDDGGSTDVGYVRSVLRPDGKVVAVYYFSDRSGPDRYIGATIWDPGMP